MKNELRYSEKSKEDIIGYLSQFISTRKYAQIETILNSRTKYLTVVLEDVHKSHNASALLRTCECFGIQDLHVIEKDFMFEPHPHIASGAARWISSHHYNNISNDNTKDCMVKLKNEGYKIVATCANGHSKDLKTVKLTTKTALVFGTEYTGVSNSVLDMADEVVQIPMFGITESLNVSVSCGIIVHHFRNLLNNSNIAWTLNEHEKQELKLQWIKNSIRNVEKYLQDYEKKITK